MKTVYVVAALALALSWRAGHTAERHYQKEIGDWLLFAATTRDGVPMCAMLESDGGSPVHTLMLVRYLDDSNLYIDIVSPAWMVEPGKPMVMKVAFNDSANIDVDAKRLSDAKVTVQSVVKVSFLNLVRLSNFLRFTIPGEPAPITFKTRDPEAPILLFEGCVKDM